MRSQVKSSLRKGQLNRHTPIRYRPAKFTTTDHKVSLCTVLYAFHDFGFHSNARPGGHPRVNVSGSSLKERGQGCGDRPESCVVSVELILVDRHPPKPSRHTPKAQTTVGGPVTRRRHTVHLLLASWRTHGMSGHGPIPDHGTWAPAIEPLGTSAKARPRFV